MVVFPDAAKFVFDDTSLIVHAELGLGITEAQAQDVFHRTILPIILQSRGWLVLHASAVRVGVGTVAIAARSETGKSTLAWALASAGFSHFADDAVAIHPNPLGGRVEVVALGCRPRLRPTSAEWFGLDTDARTSRWLGSASTPPGTRSALTAVVILERGPAQSMTAMNPLPAAEAVTTLAENAYCFDMDGRRTSKQFAAELLRVAANVPVVRLCMPSDLDRLHESVEAIARIGGERRAAGTSDSELAEASVPAALNEPPA